VPTFAKKNTQAILTVCWYLLIITFVSKPMKSKNIITSDLLPTFQGKTGLFSLILSLKKQLYFEKYST
jgi:hypothetical protein